MSCQPCGCDPEIQWTCQEHSPHKKTQTLVRETYTYKDITQPRQEAALDRKQRPIATGVLDYFPLAIAAVAYVSFIGNEQHNPGTPLHWDRSKSKDEADALMRHFVDRGKLDTDGIRHSAKVAWRALALLQKELEGEEA